MESDFIDRYAGARPELRAGIAAAYDAVVQDLINELRGAPIDPEPREERTLRSVAVAAIHYARELTRDRYSPIFAARFSKAEQRLSEALEHWHRECERRAAEWEAQQQAEREALERAKKEERRRKREAKKAKLAADGSSTA